MTMHVTKEEFLGVEDREPTELERVYQQLLDEQSKRFQLEKVAKDLYTAHIWCKGASCEGCPFANGGCDFDFGIVKEQLEALGVSLDD